MGFLQKNRKFNCQLSILNCQLSILLLLACVSCSNNYTPRPYGYYRITVPDTAYTDFSSPIMTNDALEFVYRNASFANAIPEREYNHPEADVYGVLFDLEGNTASSCQFFVTDSTRHFFRASVYCNCPPNADSLAPVYNYLRTDVIKMVETFQWTK